MLAVNGNKFDSKLVAGEYVELKRQWKKGDVLQLTLPMPAKLMEANPLVEETRNQVAVKRGPIVYCLESTDIGSHQIIDIGIPAAINLRPEQTRIGNTSLIMLAGEAKIIHQGNWNNQLYKEISKTSGRSIPVKLIPYYAWGNRGKVDMQVWIPVIR